MYEMNWNEHAIHTYCHGMGRTIWMAEDCNVYITFADGEQYLLEGEQLESYLDVYAPLFNNQEGLCR